MLNCSIYYTAVFTAIYTAKCCSGVVNCGNICHDVRSANSLVTVREAVRLHIGETHTSMTALTLPKTISITSC